MKIQFNENEIDFDQNYDMNLMEYIFQIIDKHFKVEIIQKAEVLGIDQAYWDIKINDLKFTLHYEHYLGVSLYIYKSLIIFPNKKARAKKLLHEIYILIKKDELYS